MDYREQNLGTAVNFLLPSLRLKEPDAVGMTLEARLHAFLMENFGGYTAQAGNIFGYWLDRESKATYGEHREFSVSFTDHGKFHLLKQFLAEMARELGEECIYVRSGRETCLVYQVGGIRPEG